MQMTYETLAARAIQSRIQNEKINRILKDITAGDWIVLSIIKESGIKKVTNIAKYLNASEAYVTNAVNRLERVGLVKRTGDDYDHRSKKIDYTGSLGWFEEKEEQIKEVMEQS